MQHHRLSDMTKGWFVGDFSPTVHATPAVEVGVKHYRAGDREDWHYHKIAVEVTVIVSGQVTMNGQTYVGGDIVRLEPGEGTDFIAVTDAVTAVVKMPSVAGDKYTS